MVYPNGTAIRSDDAGAPSTVAGLSIGRIDPCRVAAAAAEVVALAVTDLGSPGLTDQGNTRVVMHQASGDVVVDAYALGVDDANLPAPHQAARHRLTALIDSLRTSMTLTSKWTPDRPRVSAYGEPAVLTGARNWPLAGGQGATLDRENHRCGVLTGEDEITMLDALGAGAAVGPWTDGQQTLVLAFGPLVPGQRGCPG